MDHVPQRVGKAVVKEAIVSSRNTRKASSDEYEGDVLCVVGPQKNHPL